MDETGGTIKNKVYREVKSGRMAVDSQKDLAMHARHLIQSTTTLYLPKREIFEEPAGIKNAPYIIDTLDVHKIKREKNYQVITFLEFYCLMKKLFILTFIKNLVI